ATQVTLDPVVGLDVIAELDQVLVAEIPGAQVRADAGGGEGFLGPGRPDAVDVGERDLHPLLAGQVDADKTCHAGRSPSFLRRSGAHPPVAALSRLPGWVPGCDGPGLRPGVTLPGWNSWQGGVR